MTDFVIFWLDSTDPVWQQAFTSAKKNACDGDDASLMRIRYWDNLQYWLRGVEKFAPWVNKVHLVTVGHLPSWLNQEAPKLNIVRHEEFIPQAYLPTFNSLTIGLNLHRIKFLAEQFVVFNDDMFLGRETREEDFFRHGLPCDMARLSIVQPSSIGHIIYNDLELINKEHQKNPSIRKHIGKWLAPCYGLSNLLKTMSLMPWSTFPGLSDHHLPQPYLKQHIFACWQRWQQELDKTCHHTFRNIDNVSDYLFRYDMLIRGDFVPRSMRDGLLTTICDDSVDAIADIIRQRRYRLLCLNDSDRITDFPACAEKIRRAFHTILPDPSSFEL